MRVLVCGGRMFNEPRVLGRSLATLHQERQITLIISGGASGADRYAESWANHNKIALCVFPANWRFEGKAAGPIRNERMITFGRPDLVIAFPTPGERNAGTNGMIALARKHGVEVIQPMLSAVGESPAPIPTGCVTNKTPTKPTSNPSTQAT